MPYKIAIFASGNGSNAENISRHFAESDLARVAIVLTNKRDAGVVARMQPLGIDTFYVPNDAWDKNPASVVAFLRKRGIDMIVLAGFMHYVAPEILDAFPGQVLNIHPSLLPAYGGKGMWGHHVHEAVIAAGEVQSGATVHRVTAEMDEGEIIMQRSVKVTPDDSPVTLEAKVHEIEYELYPEAIEKALREGVTHEMEWDAATPPPMPQQEETPLQPFAQQQQQQQWQQPQQQMWQQMPPSQMPPMPTTYLLWAVLALVFCCTIPAIVAIIYSTKVSSRYYSGDYEGAEKASKNAELWIIIAFSLGILSLTLYFPFTLISTL